MSISIVLEQILIIFMYVLVGWVARKAKIVAATDAKVFSRLIIMVLLPLVIIGSSNVQTQPQDLFNMLLSTVMLLAAYIVVSVCLAWYAKVKSLPAGKKAAFTGLCVYPNSAFIGLPLCIALMGERATLFGVAGIVAYNLLFFTYQARLFNPKEKLRWQTFATPLNITTFILIIMLVFGVTLPGPVQTVTSNIGAMTTPLSLIIIGMSLAEHNLLDLLRNKTSYIITLVRNLIVPVCFLLVLIVLPFDKEMELATYIYIACPCASLTAVFATNNNMEADFCSKTILLSTLIFAGTLPVLLYLWELFA